MANDKIDHEPSMPLEKFPKLTHVTDKQLSSKDKIALFNLHFQCQFNTYILHR